MDTPGPVLICATEGCDNLVPRRSGPGRPRRRCLACAPSQMRASRLEQLKRDLSAPCGCGRHYLEVPLEEAHVCPNPALPSVTQIIDD